MPDPLDMSLDEIIRNKKKSSGASSNFRGIGSGPGPARRFGNRELLRTTPYSVAPALLQVLEPAWKQESFTGGVSTTETGTKLYISNLEYGVSNDDIKVLFSEVGELKRYSIHYDKSGRSKGTAEVVFLRQTDALAAIKRYNNVLLDGKPLKIELIGVNFLTPAVVQPTTNSILGKPKGFFRSVGDMSQPKGQVLISSSKLGLGGGRGGDWSEKISAKDLDADLEKYRIEAMQIN